MENGVGFEQIDRMPFGRYMDVIIDRAKRKKDVRPPEAPADNGKPTINLHRGTIDEVFG